jgi:hypothetical protein
MMNLKDFQTGELAHMRKACVAMLDYYVARKGPEMERCVLCDFANALYKYQCIRKNITPSCMALGRCEVCPWMIFEHRRCQDWFMNTHCSHFSLSLSRCLRTSELITRRIPMLNMWIQQIDEEIEKHENLERNRPESEHRTGPMAC